MSGPWGRLLPGATGLAWLAWSIWALSVTLALVTLYLLGLNRAVPQPGIDDSLLSQPVGPLLFPLVGALIVARYPTNPVGWLLAGLGLIGAASDFAREYARFALLTAPGSLPSGEPAAWLFRWVWSLAQGPVFTLLILLFPDGRLPSRRWAFIGWTSAVGTGLAIAASALWPNPVAGLPTIRNPLGVEDLDHVLALVGNVGLALQGTAVMLAVIAAMLRLHYARGRERQQLKWLATVVVLAALAIVADLAAPYHPISRLVGLVASVWLGIAAGMAMLRYRLYEIDLIINRTLVYVPLTAILAGLYTASVNFFKGFFVALTGNTSDGAVVLTTLAVAAAFTPVKNWLQGFADEHFKEIPSQPKALRSFARDADRLASLLDVRKAAANLLERSVTVLAATGGAVYLVEDGQLRLVHQVGGWEGEASASVPIEHDGERLGLLVLGPHRDGLAYGPSDLKLVGEAAGAVARLVALRPAPAASHVEVASRG